MLLLLFGGGAPIGKCDVALSDAAVTNAALSDAAVTNVTLSDATR